MKELHGCCYLSVLINDKGKGTTCKVVKIEFPGTKGSCYESFVNGVYATTEIAKGEGLGYENVFILNVFPTRELAENDLEVYFGAAREKLAEEEKVSGFPAIKEESKLILSNRKLF